MAISERDVRKHLVTYRDQRTAPKKTDLPSPPRHLIHNEVDQKQSISDGWDNVSLDSIRYQRSDTQAFCINLVQLAINCVPDYATSQKITTLITDLATTERKDVRITLTLQLHYAVYKNYIFKSHIRSILNYLDRHQNPNESVLHDIRTRCNVIVDRPPDLNPIVQEYDYIFQRIDESNLITLSTIFLSESFMRNISASATRMAGRPDQMDSFVFDPKNTAENLANAIPFISTSLTSSCQALDIRLPPSNPSTTGTIDDSGDYLRMYLEKHPYKQSPDDCDIKTYQRRMHSIINDLKQYTVTPGASALFSESDINWLVTPHTDTSPSAPLRQTRRARVVREPRKECCDFSRHEAFAALVNRFPVFEAIIKMNLSARMPLLMFLKLYPGTLMTVGPHIIWLELGTALLSAVAATDTILHPKSSRMPARLWKSLTNGLVFFASSLNASINIYLYYHPANPDDHMSDETFYSQIASGPIAISTFYLAWAILLPQQREALCSKLCSRYNIGRKSQLITDIVFKTLYNGGVFLFLSTTFFNLPKTLFARLIPLAPGLIVAVLQSSSYRERIDTLLTYLKLAISLNHLVHSSLPTSRDRTFQSNTQVIVRSTLLAVLAAHSTYLLASNYHDYVQNYVHEDAYRVELRRNLQSNPEANLPLLVDDRFRPEEIDRPRTTAVDQLDGGAHTPMVFSHQARSIYKDSDEKSVDNNRNDGDEYEDEGRRRSLCDRLSDCMRGRALRTS